MENGIFKSKRVYFSQVSNEALRDEKLSLKAKGLYSLIQSYLTIEGFKLYKKMLESKSKDKETSFSNAWNELKENGYLKQFKYKNKIDGTWIYQYELLDVRYENPQVENPQVENPQVENPQGGKPTPRKHGIYNNTLNNNTLNNNTITTNTITNISCSGDGDFNILKYAEMRNFILSAMQVQQLMEDINIYSLEEVKKALDIADDNGKHTYSYVKGILERRRAGTKEKSKNETEFERIRREAAERGEDPF